MTLAHEAARRGDQEALLRVIRRLRHDYHRRSQGRGGGGGEQGPAAVVVVASSSYSYCRAGLLPLHWAASKGHLGAVALLVGDHGDDIDTPTREGGCTALFLACKGGKEVVVEWLLAHGADADRPNSYGLTPLMVSSMGNHVGVVRLLVEGPGAYRAGEGGGSFVDACTGGGCTSLWLASSHGHDEVVRALLQAGADPTLAATMPPTSLPSTPTCAARASGHEGCLLLLEGWERSYYLVRARCLHHMATASKAMIETASLDHTQSRIKARRQLELPMPPRLQGRPKQLEYVDQAIEDSRCQPFVDYVVEVMIPELFQELLGLLGG